jgi:hypothetical protein
VTTTPVPSAPEAIAAAMDPWEAANGPTDLYDELVAHHGKPRADELWTAACNAYASAPPVV